MMQIAMMSVAPKSSKYWIAAIKVPPVANIGSRIKHWRPLRSLGKRFAYVDALSVFSSRTMPRKPISAFGINLTIPSSIPNPARRIGTTTGVGFAIDTPVIGATGVLIFLVVTLISRVAS